MSKTQRKTQLESHFKQTHLNLRDSGLPLTQDSNCPLQEMSNVSKMKWFIGLALTQHQTISVFVEKKILNKFTFSS